MADTKNIGKNLEAVGEMDYDYVNDILFFKIKDREYDYSIEFKNMVIDVDEEELITGIQIFDASQFLGISKMDLREIPKWKFKASIENNTIELRLSYKLEKRNKTIEKNPIIVQENKAKLPSPQMVSTV